MSIQPSIKISIGELFDKACINSIKLSKIQDGNKRNMLSKENEILTSQITKLESAIAIKYHERYGLLLKQLRETNEKLWEIEDYLRLIESNGTILKAIIALNKNDMTSLLPEEIMSFRSWVIKAREVYITNDNRTKIKRELDELFGSELTEEKGYDEVIPKYFP